MGLAPGLPTGRGDRSVEGLELKGSNQKRPVINWSASPQQTSLSFGSGLEVTGTTDIAVPSSGNARCSRMTLLMMSLV